MTDDAMTQDTEQEWNLEAEQDKRRLAREDHEAAINAEVELLKSAYAGLVDALWADDDKTAKGYAATLGIIPAQVDDIRTRIRVTKEAVKLSNCEPAARKAFDKAKAELDSIFAQHGDDHPKFFRARDAFEKAKAALFEAEGGTLRLANAHVDAPDIVSRDRLTPHALAMIDEQKANAEREQAEQVERKRREKIEALQRKIDEMSKPANTKVRLCDRYYYAVAKNRIEVARLKAELAIAQADASA